MNKIITFFLTVLSVLVFALFIGGCDGDDGVNGLTGPQGADGETFDPDTLCPDGDWWDETVGECSGT